MDEYNPKTITDGLFPMLVELLHLLKENEALAKVLLSKNGDAKFIDRLRSTIREKCFTDIHKVLDIENDDAFFLYHYIVYGCIGICEGWLSDGMKQIPEEIAKIAEDLIIASTQNKSAIT